MKKLREAKAKKCQSQEIQKPRNPKAKTSETQKENIRKLIDAKVTKWTS